MSVFHKTWDDDVVSNYIKQESQQKSPDVFLETHIPIRKIRAESLIGHNGDFVSDEQIFDHIVQSDPTSDENRIYMLKGEVGSGKSHLCQWLEYEINGDGELGGADEHVAIHISRNSTRISDILDKLYEHIDAEYDEVQDIATLNAADLADFIISSLRAFESNQYDHNDFDFEEFLEDNSNGPDLRSVLERNINEYQEAVEDEDREQRIELLEREEFNEICLLKFGRSVSDEDIFPRIRTAIHDRLMTNLGIEDFRGELIDIADQYQAEGKRPVLICEDVTTFTVMKDDFMDHIFQLGDGGETMQSGFDVVLGYTTGWESEKADDALMVGDLSYMRQRAVGYLVMTNRDGEAYFLEEGAMPIQLVEQYLEAIKSHSDVPEHPSIDDDAFDDLYPFSKRFIIRAYDHLEEDGNLQQTPRLLLYHVIGDCLRASVPPHEKVRNHGYLRDFSAPTAVGGYDSSFRSLTKWYGRMDDGDVVVPEACFEAFDIPIPDETTVEDGLVRLNVVYEDIGWTVPDSDLKPIDPSEAGAGAGEVGEKETDDEDDSGSGGEIDPTTGKTKTSSTVDSDGESDRSRKISQFQDWYGTGGDFPSSNRLKEGVRAALEAFYDPARLANENATTDGTAGFYHARGDLQVEIRGADQSKERAIVVPHKPDGAVGEDVYEQLLLNFMIRGLDGEFRPGTDFDAVRAWADNKVVDFRSKMRDDLEAELPEGMTLEEFLVMSRFLLQNAAEGVSSPDRVTLLRDPDEYNVPETSPFKQDDPLFDVGSLRSNFIDLSTRKTDLGLLCQGFFLLKQNFVDEERLSPAIESVSENFEDYLAALTKISASEIPDAYRIGTTRNQANVQVSALYEAVSDYATALRKLEQTFDVATIKEDIDVVEGLYSPTHTIDDLTEMYNRLKEAIAPLDINFKERWERVSSTLARLSDEDIEEFGSIIERYRKAAPQNGAEILSLMYGYSESRAVYDEWNVYETLSEMLGELEDHEDVDGNEFRELVRDSTEFTAVQQARGSALNTIEGI